MRVVLPAPFRPTSPILSPAATLKFTPLISVRAPIVMSRSFTLSKSWSFAGGMSPKALVYNRQ